MAPAPSSAPASAWRGMGVPVVPILPRAASPSSASSVPASSELDTRSIAQESSPHLPYLNFTTRAEKRVSASAAEHSITQRSDRNLTARTDQNLTGRPDYSLASRSDYNLTERAEAHLVARSSDLTTRTGQNLTVRSKYNFPTRSSVNLTARPDLNFTSRSDLNITARSVHNLTARSGVNFTAREEDHNSTNLPLHKMIIRTADFEDGLAGRDVQSAHLLVSRADTTYIPCRGCTDPTKINNKAFFALFALVFVAMVVAAIWFFFHAKNGGFVFQENDWDDYKSTVLRRKGPDGKTLSNATKSTKLGGGSVVNHHDRLAAMTVVGYDEKGRKGIRAKRGFAGTHSVYYDDDFSKYSGSRADEKSEVSTNMDYHRVHHRSDSHDLEAGKHHSRRYGGRDRDVREYKQEKPARVGGMNRVADGSNYTYSDDTATQISESTNRSTANLIRDKDGHSERERERDPVRTEQKKRAKAERKAHEEASRMERKWRKDAEAAARAIARENAPAPVPPQHAHRARRDSRSGSPKKRDYSFSKGADEALSTAYTASSSGDRTASYYDAYRPKNDSAARAASRDRHGESSRGYRRYAESEAETSDSGTRVYEHRLGKGPVKEKKSAKGGRDVMAGYRRGRDEDDF